MEENFKILEWDTKFFGFKVAKVIDDLTQQKHYNPFTILHSQDIRLAFHNSKQPILPDYLHNDLYDGKLVIKRIPITKKLNTPGAIHRKVYFYEKEYPDKDLIALAQLAGSQGRFGNDPNISAEKCNTLFKIWIENSVKKEMADEVLVYKEEGRILGFATLKIEKENAYAPLFAVQREFEGKGVSFALMNAVETIAARKGAETLMSGTQEKNLKALKVYERFGMVPGTPEYVYHFWKK